MALRVILGIDPGSARTGFGAVAVDGGGRMSMVECGCIKTAPPHTRSERLRMVHEGLREVIARIGPNEVAVEQLFFSRNVQTAMLVGEARGVALLAAALSDLPVSEYNPVQVKEALTGYGNAKKEQVRQVVMMQLELASPPRPVDASDALAIAMTHVFLGDLEP